ncbi:hypothetical protein L323_19120 [Ruminiclostridium papyrosolvens C7]|uniref:Uncharacterized protein n=1 Tax=Ruminiclostridium papyrosolvens C7 TaxID=1330534 RepID=U4QX47_9FIRM|nr:hypothetical protein L323_19120 [Ruminiclostridium papyrosolvens C7]
MTLGFQLHGIYFRLILVTRSFIITTSAANTLPIGYKQSTAYIGRQAFGLKLNPENTLFVTKQIKFFEHLFNLITVI